MCIGMFVVFYCNFLLFNVICEMWKVKVFYVDKNVWDVKKKYRLGNDIFIWKRFSWRKKIEVFIVKCWVM